MKKAAPKNLTAKFIVGMTLTAAMTTLLVACGQSKTDKEYSALRNNPDSPPISQAQAIKQNLATLNDNVPGAYVIVKTDADQSSSKVVHEGDTVTMTGTARVGVENVSFTLGLQNAPSDAQLTQVNDNGTVRWTLTWKTPVGKIPAGKDYLEVQPVVVVLLGKLTDDQNKLLKNDLASNSTKLSLDIKVTKVSDKPLISTVVGLDNDPIEGTAVPFEIDVYDPGSLSGTAPTVTISADTAHASVDGMVDVSSFITPDPSKPAQSTGNGNWKIFFVFNSGDKLLSRPAKHSSVGLDQGRGMYLATVTSSSKLSDAESESFNLKFNTEKQTPVFTVKDPTQVAQVTMGQLNKIDITVTSADSSGKLKQDVTGTKAALKLLPSQAGTTAKAACQPATADGMECEIRWTPSCTADADKTESVQLKAINTVGGISASGTWSQDIKMVKPDNCGAKPAKTATTKAGKASVKPTTAAAATGTASVATGASATTKTPTATGAKTATAPKTATSAARAAAGTAAAGAVSASPTSQTSTVSSGGK